ncbi:MAG: hypothetical protein KBC35_02795 [Candidatus Pacebacteria bacterium]|nr:hypothetical protein [Candidatus Paceibacterota bacterium]
MPDPSNNSFIPKRGPAPRGKHGPASRRVYLFTIVSYIVLFATLLATGGVFFYTSYITQERNLKVSELDKAINSFSEEGMREVLKFDARLQQASDRLNSSVSVLSIFKALEESTIDTVAIQNLEMKRQEDDEYLLTASIITDSFDSTIFQRDTYQGNQTISNVLISDVSADIATDEDSESTETEPVVTFTATLNVPVGKILYDPATHSSSDFSETTTIVTPTENETTASTTSAEVIDNEETI